MRTLLAFVVWAVDLITLPTSTRPNAGAHASTAKATWSWRYRARHAASRKRATA